MKKRAFFAKATALLLAFIMVFGAAPIGVLAELDLKIPEWLKSPFTTRAEAASVSDLTFRLINNDTEYEISDCYESASGELLIPSTYNGKPVTSIGDSAFENCDGLTTITIPDSVTSIGDYAFSSCDGLTSINVASANQYYSSDSFGVLFNKDKTKLIQYPKGNEITSYEIPDSVTSIGDAAFAKCDGLTTITIPDSVTSVGDGAFSYCFGLSSVTIGDNVNSISAGMFFSCDSLTSAKFR